MLIDLAEDFVGQRKEDMLARQQRVLAATRLFDGAIDHALRGFGEFGQRNIQIVDIHGSNSLCGGGCKASADCNALSNARQVLPRVLLMAACPLRSGWSPLKAGDGAAGIALEFLNMIRARRRQRVVAATRGTLEELERAVWLRSAASSRTPIGVPASHVGLCNRNIVIAHAYQSAAAVGATRRSQPLLFVHEHFTSPATCRGEPVPAPRSAAFV